MGEKTAAIRRAVAEFTGAFHITELQRNCPAAGMDLVRKVLKDLRREGTIECQGRGGLFAARILFAKHKPAPP